MDYGRRELQTAVTLEGAPTPDMDEGQVSTDQGRLQVEGRSRA